MGGSINSGKSTTSRLLVERLPRAAHVQGDALRHFVTRLPLEEAVPITLQNIIAVAIPLPNWADYLLEPVVYDPEQRILLH